MNPEISQLKNQIAELQKKVDALYNPATISEVFVGALVARGFLRYDNTKIITFTNPSGKDFYSIFAKYANENIAVSIEAQSNFIKIDSINTSTDVLTSNNHGLSNGQTVYFATTNTPPTGVSLSVSYTISSATTNTFKLDFGGSPINITSIGSGNHYIRPQ